MAVSPGASRRRKKSELGDLTSPFMGCVSDGSLANSGQYVRHCLWNEGVITPWNPLLLPIWQTLPPCHCFGIQMPHRTAINAKGVHKIIRSFPTFPARCPVYDSALNHLALVTKQQPCTPYHRRLLYSGKLGIQERFPFFVCVDVISF